MKTETIIIAQGFIAGIIIALPKGPAGFAVINQTIVYGFARGFIIALGCIATTILITPVVLFPTMDFVKNFFDYTAIRGSKERKIFLGTTHVKSGKIKIFSNKDFSAS